MLEAVAGGGMVGRLRLCPRCLTAFADTSDRCPHDGSALLASGEDPLIGRVVNSYRVEELVGMGGMARVYRAHHTFFDRRYAIKFMHGHIAQDAAHQERFRREAKVIAELSHPNIVGVVDFGATPEGLPFLVMEWVAGATLSASLGTPMVAPRAGELARQIAQGLAAAHARGFVHRDLKPANVMLTRDAGTSEERVKILDFGLARSLRTGSSSEDRLTRAGALVGTPGYMAPEVILGADASALGDLFALGVTLYLMLTGELPFPRDKWLDAVAIQRPPRPPRDDTGLGALALRLLAAKAVDRPQSARAVIEQIDALSLPRWVPPDVKTEPYAPALSALGTQSYPALTPSALMTTSTEDADATAEQEPTALSTFVSPEPDMTRVAHAPSPSEPPSADSTSSASTPALATPPTSAPADVSRPSRYVAPSGPELPRAPGLTPPWMSGAQPSVRMLGPNPRVPLLIGTLTVSALVLVLIAMRASPARETPLPSPSPAQIAPAPPTVVPILPEPIVPAPSDAGVAPVVAPQPSPRPPRAPSVAPRSSPTPSPSAPAAPSILQSTLAKYGLDDAALDELAPLLPPLERGDRASEERVARRLDELANPKVLRGERDRVNRELVAAAGRLEARVYAHLSQALIELGPIGDFEPFEDARRLAEIERRISRAKR